MSKEIDYRENAAETFELAQHASSSRDKGRLLALAEKWLDLADRARRVRLAGKTYEHPLLKAKLGNEGLNTE